MSRGVVGGIAELLFGSDAVGPTQAEKISGDVEALFELVAEEHDGRIEDRNADAARRSFDRNFYARLNDRVDAALERYSELHGRVDVVLLIAVLAAVGGLAGVAALVGSVVGWW